MYIGESKCKQCEEPIKAKWYNEESKYDIGKHNLKRMAVLLDGTMTIEYECHKCGSPNMIELNFVE